MRSTRRFPKTLRAVKRTGSTQGAIGEALRADIVTAIGDRAHPISQFLECEVFLHQQGYDFGEAYLGALYRAAATPSWNIAVWARPTSAVRRSASEPC